MESKSQNPVRAVMRREPKQERSRERIDEILKVAMELIGRKGIDAVTMKEIASLSGGPIASVYQYFPNKSAIVATLYERHAQRFRVVIEESLSGIDAPADVVGAARRMFEGYRVHVRNHPHTHDLINAIQADKALQNVDVMEMRTLAEKFTAVTRGFVPEARREEYGRNVFLLFYLASGAVRLAHMLPGRERDKVLADFGTMIEGQIGFFLESGPPVAD